MGNRRFEMYEYRHVIYRMRLGESDRAIAKAGLMGRPKAAELRKLAKKHGWLKKGPLPADIELAREFDKRPPPSAAQSLVLPYAEEVEAWCRNGIQGTTIHQALEREYGFSGSYYRSPPTWRLQNRAGRQKLSLYETRSKNQKKCCCKRR